MPAQANANVVEQGHFVAHVLELQRDVIRRAGAAAEVAAIGVVRSGFTAGIVAQVSPIFFRFAIEITKLVEYATTGRERAVENAAKREVANGMKQFRAFLDKLMQTAGNGVLGTISSFASTTCTMATPPGAALVYAGQTIQVYDSTLTTNRGTANVTAADPISPTQTITVDVNPAGLTNGDVIVHDGLSGAQPVSVFGIKYHQNNATTGTWLNLNRATYPVQLATPRVNAGNAALTPSNVRLAINKVRKALGINHLSKLIAYMAVEQEHAWKNLGITVSQIIKEGGGGNGNDLDLLFSGRKTMSGIPIKSSVNADQTRVDFLDLSHWGRAVLKDIAAELAATKQLLVAADARQHDRDTQLAQTLATLAAEKRTIVTPAQILRELPSQISLPSPIVLQSAPALPNSPTPKVNAVFSAEDLKPLYDFTIDCKACQSKLAAAQGDLFDEQKKTAALTKERDDALRIARGGSAWRRIGRAAKWFLIGATAGAIASKAAH